MRFRWGFAVFALVCTGCAGLLGPPPPVAPTKKTVAIMKVDGVSTAAVRRAMLGAAGERYQMANVETSRQVARWFRGRELTSDGVARIAKRLKLDIVIEGYLQKKRGKALLVLHVRDGRSGEVMTSFDMPIKRNVDRKKHEERLRQELESALAEYEALQEPDPSEIRVYEDPSEQRIAERERTDERRPERAPPVREERDVPRSAPPRTDAAGFVVDEENPDFLPARYR